MLPLLPGLELSLQEVATNSLPHHSGNGVMQPLECRAGHSPVGGVPTSTLECMVPPRIRKLTCVCIRLSTPAALLTELSPVVWRCIGVCPQTLFTHSLSLLLPICTLS
eukprot:GGOE01055504.1.p2 GENE.GGOE01055504.1~~GGOE01055504.1.p2  ORF type:complete len:108 (+),score=5.94 GGOE01055504.1:931-1254(+)